jgi:hypothetical protein
MPYMYEPLDDQVVLLTDVPRPDRGAPMPAFLASERRLGLVYIVAESDPDWDGTSVTIATGDEPNEPYAVVVFRGPRCHYFGDPNHRDLEGHPLASRGLKRYAVWEVTPTSWIRALEEINTTHDSGHTAKNFRGLRHFIFTFHDTTFECLADGLAVYRHRGTQRSALNLAASKFAEM